jgi:AcrR family transcriptional regulator
MPFASAARVPSSLHASLRPTKGEQTRAAIVEAALDIARREGLEGLTIGALAEQTRMSKSGVFAHFGSREDLQLAVLSAYAAHFVDQVLRPAVRKPRGLPRLQAMLDNWVALLARELQRGCLMIAGSSEYDDRSGPLRDAMVSIVSAWKAELLRAIEQATAEGHLRRGLDAEQLVFEIYGLMLVLHQDARLLRSHDSVRRARAGLARLLADARRPAARSAQRAAAGATVRRLRKRPARGDARAAGGSTVKS